MNNQNNRKKYDYIFIDEGQDLLPREIEFLKIICPHNKTGWWINFDSSQQWKPETITFEQLNSCFDKHKPHVYNLKKALRIANPIRERIIVRNNFNIKDYTPNNFNYLTDSQYTELNCEQKKLNTLLNDQVKNFKEMKFEDNEIAVITEDSYDTFMQLNNNTVLLTNADFINTISPNIYFDSILRTKGLEFPVVIILMKKDSIDTPRCKQYRYIAETRSQLHITLIKVS
jgi:superfamily I DNA and RNA helicase